MSFDYILLWFQDILKSVLNISEWFITPIEFEGLSFTPLGLLTASGLIAFLGVAIVKWVIS